jgi:hypothetical protein
MQEVWEGREEKASYEGKGEENENRRMGDSGYSHVMSLPAALEANVVRRIIVAKQTLRKSAVCERPSTPSLTKLP